MKKKIVLVALLVLCLAAPAFSATRGVTKRNTVGLGLNLGTNTGLGFRYGLGDFDVVANLGVANFGFNPFNLGLDASASYRVYTIDGGRNLQFPITVGAGLNANFLFDDTATVDLGVIVPVGIEYTFNEVPITLYLKLGPEFKFLNANKVGFEMFFVGYIGALWNF